MYTQQIKSTLLTLSDDHSLSQFSPIYAGERKVPLYECRDELGQKKVVKLGIGGREQRNEVIDNIYGYTQIQSIGGEAILPSNLKIIDIHGIPAFIMDHLGDDFGDQVKGGDLSAYSTFFGRMGELFQSLASDDRKGQASGLQVIQVMLNRWYGELVTEHILDASVLTAISSLPIDDLAGSNNTLMLLDFTPNNIFTGDGKVSFIDPWRQESYLGSPIPGLGQFITLSDDIHDYPGAKENRAQMDSFALSLGRYLDMSTEQISAKTHWALLCSTHFLRLFECKKIPSVQNYSQNEALF